MAAWRLDGKPRTARQCAVYKHCPLPTPEDRRFFLLTYLKTSEFIPMYGTMPPREGGSHDGWWTVYWPAVPPAFLDIPSGPWPRCRASYRPVRPRGTCIWDADGTLLALQHFQVHRTRWHPILASAYTQCSQARRQADRARSDELHAPRVRRHGVAARLRNGRLGR
jgi:hypothetical protein